jgi:hypothetical protein
MNVKSFFLGIVAGALIYAGGTTFLSDERDEQQTPKKTPAKRSAPVIAPSISESGPESQLVDRAEDVKDGRKQQPTTQPGDLDEVVSTSNWPATAQQRLAKEQKDQDWAYFTERAIVDSVSAHSLAGEFHIVYVECRMTLCQIKVNGYGESSVPKWNQIIYDLAQESWAEFGQRGMSSGVTEGQFVIIQELHRR